MQTEQTTQRPIVHNAGGGQHFHFLNHLATVKAPAGTEGQLSVVEFLAPRGFGPPMHRHNHEDELFVVLAGELVMKTDDTEMTCGEGGVALLPRGIAHGFQVLSDEARFINVTGSSVGAPQFDAMVAALGTPIDQPKVPAPVPVDPGEVAAVCAEHGIDILGPPPPPLD